MVPSGFDVAKEFPGVADSKRLTPQKREELFERLVAIAGDPSTTGSLSPGYGAGVRFCVEFEDHKTIDEWGIVRAVHRALARGVNKLTRVGSTKPVNSKFRHSNFRHPMSEFHIMLDGLLKAPPRFSQETVIRGDETVPIISLASIAAKVLRDRHMTAIASDYPLYGFDSHKGYGTPGHYSALALHGPCVIHRRTYLHLDLAQSKV